MVEGHFADKAFAFFEIELDKCPLVFIILNLHLLVNIADIGIGQVFL